MILTLWKKECKQIMKSLIYLLYVIALILFYASQMGGIGDSMTKEPEAGKESYREYGRTDKVTEQEMMEYGLDELVWGYCAGRFTTYPVGFAKSVKPDEEDMDKIADIICEMTGISKEELWDKLNEYIEAQERTMYYDSTAEENDTDEKSWEPSVKAGYEYQDFLSRMEEVRDIVGPGSSFSEENLKSGARKPLDFEGAKEAYNSLVYKDGYTGGYERLFCDYMGILMGILPVFLIVSRVLRDRRAGMQELVFGRSVSSTAVICTRYAASVCMAMLPVVLLSVLPTADCIMFTKGSGIRLDYLSFLKYDLGWILPTVMAVSAVGIFLTELTESALAVLVQAVWWYVSILTGARGMGGGAYGWNLVPRHNTEMNYSGFADGFIQLTQNRILYVILSLALVGAAVFIYERKRKGHLRRSGKILGDRKSTASA